MSLHSVYQEYLAKSLTERSNSLSGQLDKIIRDANSEIGSLRDKVAAMALAEEELRRKNHELMEGWREKGRKLAQTQVCSSVLLNVGLGVGTVVSDPVA